MTKTIHLAHRDVLMNATTLILDDDSHLLGRNMWYFVILQLSPGSFLSSRYGLCIIITILLDAYGDMFRDVVVISIDELML